MPTIGTADYSHATDKWFSDRISPRNLARYDGRNTQPMTDHQGKVEAILDGVAAEEPKGNKLGRLTDETARLIRESEVMKIVAPKEAGGYEAHPREFMEAVMKIGAVAPSAGWVSGVVGIHPFEFGQTDPRMIEDIWGSNQDAWTASPYAPTGVGRKVDGGYLLSGSWPFSTGSDHSDWFIFGGKEADENGVVADVPVIKHFVLPKTDAKPGFEPNSWEVMGLQGTGSHTVTLKDVFIPDYRAIDAIKLNTWQYADEFKPESALYHMPFGVMFSGTINCGTLAIAKGVIDRFSEYLATRKTAFGASASDSPFQLRALGIARADIEASMSHVLNDVTEMFDYVSKGNRLTPQQVSAARRNQVRATRRAYHAAQLAFEHGGGNATRLSNPMQQFWRDLSVGISHVSNVDEPTYRDAAMHELGIDVEIGMRI